jgi:hypothetical protein
LNVRYIAAEFDVQADGLQLEKQFGSTRLYRNLQAAPRLWLQTDPSADASVEMPELILWKPERIDIQAQGPGLLVLSEIVYPGWQVWVDGVPQPVESYDGLLRAVHLSSGGHRVVFTYRPTSLFLGMVGFVIAGLYLLLAGWLRRRAGAVQPMTGQVMVR